jgi:ACS family tartrate transporter-like MFS transporter
MLLYLSYWFPQAYIGRFTAMFMAAPVGSLAIGGPLASLILGLDGVLGLHGWQWLFVLEGLPALILAFSVLRFLPDAPSQAAWLTRDEKLVIDTRFAAEDGAKQRDLLPALRDPRVLVLGLVNFFQLFASTGIALWLPQYVQAMGFSTTTTGFVSAVPFICGVAAMILWGRSSDYRQERVWHIVLPALLAATAFIAAATMQDYRLVLAALVLVEIGIASALGPVFSFPSSFLRGRAAAGGIAMFNMIGYCGSFVGPYLIGVLRQQTGGYASGMVMMAAALALSALITIALGRAMVRRPIAIPATA